MDSRIPFIKIFYVTQGYFTTAVVGDFDLLWVVQKIVMHQGSEIEGFGALNT